MLAGLDAGATGSMTGGGFPYGLRPIVDEHPAGRREAAVAGYERWLRLMNHENRRCGLLAAKALMKEGGVIASDRVAPPPRAAPPRDAGRPHVETARRLDPLVLRWALARSGVSTERRAP